MAKSAAVKIVRVPSFGARAKAIARRGASVGARMAMAEKHTAAAVGAAAVLGFAARSGVQLPKIDAIGTAGTYGLVAWAIGRWTRSNVAQHVATGLLSVAAYQLASGGSVSGDDAGEI
jgi:hypothetical protein